MKVSFRSTRTLIFHVVLMLFRSFTKGQITVYPIVEVQAEGVPTLFHCNVYAEQVSGLNWRVNGTSLVQDPRPNITENSTTNITSVSLSAAVLTILALPQYNGTIAQCVALPSRNVSDNVTLLVQGVLMSVQKLAFDTNSTTSTLILITWEAPFSLNLTTAEPDVQYCVNVYNVTEGEELVESRCDITETNYIYTPDNPSPDHLFNFTVTPRSNVPGSLNGTRIEPVQGYVFHRPFTIPLDVISYHVNSRLSPITWQFPVEVLGTTPGRMPSHYSVHLLSIDDPDNPSECNCSATNEVVSDYTIQLTLQWCSNCAIQRHRVYSCVISAMNSAGTSASDTVELSTHNIQNLTAIQKFHNESNCSEIDIAWSYLSGSSPTGLFAIISSQRDQTEVHYVVVNEERQTSTCVSIGNLTQEPYGVFVYDLGEDLLPEISPARSKVSVINSSQNTTSSASPITASVSSLQPPPTVEYLGNGRLCINCSFSGPSVNACVVIVHSTHNTSNLLGKQLKVFSIERNVAYDCLEVDEDEYHVAVFGLLRDYLENVPAIKTIIRVRNISKEIPTTGIPFTTLTTNPDWSSNIITAIVIGVVSTAVFIVIVVVVIITALFTVRRKKTLETRDFQQDSPPGYASLVGFRNANISQNEIAPEDIIPDPVSSRYEECPLTKTVSNYENVELSERNRRGPFLVPESVSPIDGQAEDITNLNHTHAIVSDLPGSHIGEPDPSYEVVESVLVRKSRTNTGPPIDGTATQHQYSEIKGTICQGLHYAHVDLKTSSHQPEDSTVVVYSTVDKEKLVSESKECNEPAPQQESTPPTLPQPPTAESLLSIIHPIASKWEEFGKALQIDEDRLDEFFTNNEHDQLRLRHMLEYYFMNVHFKHTWEEVIQALREIGEYECADKIVREKRLEGGPPVHQDGATLETHGPYFEPRTKQDTCMEAVVNVNQVKMKLRQWEASDIPLSLTNHYELCF